MEFIAKDLSLMLDLFSFLFMVFLALLPYFIFLYWSGFYKRYTPSLTLRQVVHNFYILLTCFTFGFTLAYLHIFPQYFFGAAVVALLLLLVSAYLFYLQSTDVVGALVISQQLPVLLLVITILVSLVALLYTGVLLLAHADMLLKVTNTHLITQAIQGQQADQGAPNQPHPPGEARYRER